MLSELVQYNYVRNVEARGKPFEVKLLMLSKYEPSKMPALEIEFEIRIEDMKLTDKIIKKVRIEGSGITLFGEKNKMKEFLIEGKVRKIIRIKEGKIEIAYVEPLTPTTMPAVSYDPLVALRDILFVPVLRGGVAPTSTLYLGNEMTFPNLLGALNHNKNLSYLISDMLSYILGYSIRLDSRFVRKEGNVTDIWALENISFNSDNPVNVALEGFGGVQLMYLLYYLLSSNKGGTLCVEEPEIHLHPASQARLVEKLVETAKEKDLQLMISTHSEHILFKFLNLVAGNVISHNDLKVFYFSRKPKAPEATVEELKVTPEGELEGGLKGFFEHEVNMFEEYIKARASHR